MTERMGDDLLRRLLRGISSHDPKEREHWADAVTDVSGALPPGAVNLVAQALVDSALSETAPAALESKLNALNEMTGSQPFDRVIVAPLLTLDRSSLGGSELEALDELGAYQRGEREARSIPPAEAVRGEERRALP